MTPTPPSTPRVVAIQARFALRRFVNRLRRPRARAGKRRDGTPTRGGFHPMLVGLFALLFAFQSVLLCSRFVSRASADIDAAVAGDAAPRKVDLRLWLTLRFLADYEHPMGPEKGREYAAERVREIIAEDAAHPTDAEQRVIDAILERLAREGIAGFRSDDFSFLPDPEALGRSVARAEIRGGIGLALALVCLAALLMTLGTANQDLGRVDWSLEWLFTLPVSTRSLLVGKVLEYASINPFGWLTILPLLFVSLLAAGHGWLAALAVGALATATLHVMLGSLRMWAETMLRMRLPLTRVKNVQAVCTLAGVLTFYTVLYLLLAREIPQWFLDAALALGDRVALVPVAAPALLIAGGGIALAAGAGTAMIALAGAWLAVASAARALRGGLLATSNVFAGTRAPVGGSAGRMRGVLGKDLRLFLRDRAFLVQTAVVPVLVIGFQVVLNPGMLEAAGRSFDHGATLAFGIGAYAVLAGGMSVLQSEGKALWLLYSLPVPLGDVLRRKVFLWSALGLCYTAAVLAMLIGYRGTIGTDVLHGAALATVGVVLYAFIAAGLGVLGARPLEQSEQRRVKPGTVYLYLLLASLYSYGIYAQQWWTQVTMVVLCAALARAIWQKVGDRIPFLLDPTAAPRPRITLGDGLIATVVFFVAQGLLAHLMVAGPFGARPTAETVTIAAGVVGAIVVLGAVGVLALRGVPDLLHELGLARTGESALRAALLGVVLGGLAAAVALTYVRWMGEVPWLRALESEAPSVALVDRRASAWVAVLVIGLAPLVEEVLFRGLVFRGFRDTLSLPLAAAASAAIFAIVHPPAGWLPVFALGVATAVAYDRARMLLAPIVAHVVYNAIVVAAQTG